MLSLPNYKIIERLCETVDFVTYRALRQEDQKPVFVKTPSSQHPSVAILHRLEHEFEVGRQLDPALVLRPLSLEWHGGRGFLVLENGVGQPLRLLKGPMEVLQFLKIAVTTAVALDEVHRHNFVHKDIKPENIWVDRGGQARLTGFGIASELPRERQTPESPEVIAGTLAYMAPEHTGRMNRSIDSRSDLYSLGITFYEMLTGGLPFAASDPMEWVHCQIARSPPPPHQRVSRIPEMLSAIVMKLLSKPAGDRYQTALGLRADLLRCQEEWEKHGRIEPFQLGRDDITDRFSIPEELYGREPEIEALLAAFDRVVTQGTSELVLVSGYSGIGKSSLVNELHKVLVPPRGLFASGKFDQFKRDVPYATIVQALQRLVRLILGKSEGELKGWRDAIQKGVGSQGQLIVTLIPEVELIIGEQPPVPDLPPLEAQNRFQTVLRRFIGVFARPEHPLALFLDDLQWLDTATRELLAYLATEPEVRYLLLIGAYRDNEVTPSHPLMRTVEMIRDSGARMQKIVLSPLVPDDMTRLVSDSLHCKRDRAMPLARLIHQKTGGNPFFAIQFLSALVEEQLITFDPKAVGWVWNLSRIDAKGYTDNVVDLMVGKLKRLPEKTREVLKQLACLGNTSEVATLAMISTDSSEAIHEALREAVRAELVFRLDDNYTFLHDRVQEAAYSLIPVEDRKEVHLNIGRLLAVRIGPEELKQRIFEVVNQLDRGATLITDPEEREQVAGLNLTAGVRAKDSAAYSSALNYLTTGCGLLSSDRWQRQYPLTFALEFHRGECEFLTGKLVAAEERLAILSRQARTLRDLAAVACLRVDLFTTLNQNERSVEMGLEYLQRIGIQWQAHPSEEEVQKEYDQLWRKIGSRSIEELADLPEMTDPDWYATMDVLIVLCTSAMFTDQNLLCLAVGRAANLSLEHGNTNGSCQAFVWLGMILGPRFGDYGNAFQFGKLGFDLVEKPGMGRYKARVFLCFGQHVIPWRKHIQTGRVLVRRAFEVATDRGDVTYAAYTCSTFITHLLASGDPLSEVGREAQNGLEFDLKAQFSLAIDIITPQIRLIQMLRGLTLDFGSFNDAGFSEDRFEKHLEEDSVPPIAVCWYWIRKLQARFFAGDYRVAVAAASKAELGLWTSLSFFETTEYHFFSALARASSYDTADSDEKPYHLNALVAHHRQLEIWAENCPENFESRSALTAAEIARIEGRELDAQYLYEKAIRSARENGFFQNEGISNELAANFYAKRGFDTISHTYFREARYCYLRWGADGKVKQLDEQYPWLAEAKPLGTTGTIVASSDQLDLVTVIKAQHAISGEIHLDQLAETLLRIVLENAGAQKAYLSVEPDVQLLASVRSDQSIEFYQIPAGSASSEIVILGGAKADTAEFQEDPYLQETQPKSVLCMPILRQKNLIGVLYLENNLAIGTFTPSRCALLEMLVSQAAISLETAKLYSALQQSQNELQNQKLTLQSILDSIGEGVAVADEHGEFLLFNPAAEEILGVGKTKGGPESWTGHFGLFLPDQTTPYPPTNLPLARAVRGESVDAEELFVRHPRSPEGHWLSVTARQVIDKGGKAHGGVIVFADVTKRRQAEENERQARATAEAALQAREDFMALAAHELRTPLTPLKLKLQMLREVLASEKLSAFELQPKLLKLFKSSNQEVDRLTRLVEDLLDFSRISSGHLTIYPEVMDLSELLREVVDRYQPDLGRANCPLDLHVENNIIGQWDRFRIEQIVINLLTNAIKFGAGKPIQVTGSKEWGHAKLIIRDHGIGIEKKDLERIFNRFERAVSISHFQGLGLGLYISRKIIESHGGTIRVESQLGEGSAFTVELPLT
jgi:predicted ATPase/signal transduction histidine kinase/GAF domain-containing protein